ncbi:MAG: YigZ family protein, partial [Prevotella sp.]|nr:YigZ family protein [Prevotella sp.]
DAIANANIEERLIEEEIVYNYPYVMMNDVMRIVKDLQPRIVSQTFDNTCEIKLSIRKSEAPRLRSMLEKLSFEH